MESVIEANNKFTVDLHKALKNDQNFTSRNLFYSPSSLSIALAMTFMGAKEDTAGQMAQALHWKAIPQEQLHMLFKKQTSKGTNFWWQIDCLRRRALAWCKSSLRARRIITRMK